MTNEDYLNAEELQNKELAKIWLMAQDLSKVSPATVKRMFFEAWHEIDQTPVERWD